MRGARGVAGTSGRKARDQPPNAGAQLGGPLPAGSRCPFVRGPRRLQRLVRRPSRCKTDAEFKDNSG